MLIYTKIVNGEKHLFGTENNVPSDNDTQLTYKDENGDVVANVSSFAFFYGKSVQDHIFANDSKRGIPTDSDQKINVWLGDTLVIGKEEEVVEK